MGDIVGVLTLNYNELKEDLAVRYGKLTKQLDEQKSLSTQHYSRVLQAIFTLRSGEMRSVVDNRQSPFTELGNTINGERSIMSLRVNDEGESPEVVLDRLGELKHKILNCLELR